MLYNKYRPQALGSVIGQAHITQTLQNALKRGGLSHAYLFSGPRGTGKTSVARILAKCLNCAQGVTDAPCNECEACKRIAKGIFIDVLEMDAASNRGIDEIRSLKERVYLSPTTGRYKVYIIDEVHMLTPEAFNALLKTLEEPPKHVVFILATTERHRVPSTIVSRCLCFDFRPLSSPDISSCLRSIIKKEGGKFTQDALSTIARYVQGSLRDAIGMAEQLFTCGREVREKDVLALLGIGDIGLLFEASRAAREGDISRIINVVDKAVEEGHNIGRFTEELAEHFRNLLVVKVADNDDLVKATPETIAQLRSEAEGFSKEKLMMAVEKLGEAHGLMRFNPSPRLLLETAMLNLISSNPSMAEVLAKLEAVEEKLGSPQEEKAPKIAKEKILPTAADKERMWRLILDKIKEKRVTTYALLLDCNPKIKGKAVSLRFPKAKSFHREEIGKPQHLTALTEAAEEILGEGAKINLE